MSLNAIGSVFTFLGGLGMFLYGMNIMGDGMQKSAGNSMNRFLQLVTNNRLLAIALGALITAILHSSGATTVMVVGFVNAGILNLTQAVGVIMGANIGTTITAWMVSLNQLGDAMKVLQPSFFAPLFVAVGAFGLLFSKKKKDSLVGEICIGVGFLFVGLTFMSSSVAPYTDLPIFAKAFAVLGSNPILGILVGALVTAVIQSSTASVGILQTLAMSGIVSTSAAVYITLGQNIGSCLTALLSSAGASRNAKRASVIHLTFNTAGAAVFGVGMYLISLFAPEIALGHIDSLGISMFHTFFNLTNTVLLFPFAKQLVAFSGLIVKETKEEAEEAALKADTALLQLDERIFQSPPLALEIGIMEVVHMGKKVEKNLKRSLAILTSGDTEQLEAVYENEKAINAMNKKLTEYLIKVNNLSLNEKQKRLVSNLFYSISDIERVGDHAENIADSVRFITEHDMQFSETGLSDLKEIGNVAAEAFSHAIAARHEKNFEDIRKVSKLEDEVDILEEELRDKHIERLSKGECNPSTGAVFLDILSNLERVSDHAYNVAGYVKDEI
ncbi:MAG: Na/Pi cotransporter family protein [Lachnospiraceae bacterium]|nr:Na/Pi cotransporter family protein [Lachnospiraceae bacterium]